MPSPLPVGAWRALGPTECRVCVITARTQRYRLTPVRGAAPDVVIDPRVLAWECAPHAKDDRPAHVD